MYGKKYIAFGETHHLAEWSRKTGISIWTIKARLQRGWSMERALSQPINTRKSKVLYRGRYYTYSDLSRISTVNASPGCIRYRIVDLKWTVQDALTKPKRYDGHTSSAFHGRIPKDCTYPDCDKCPFDDCYAG